MRKLATSALAAVLVVIGCTTSAPPSPLEQPIPLDPAVRQGVLPNGLTYYIRVNKKPENRAELRLAVNAGSVLETDAQRGIAHFVEHMAFNGTENFEKQELVNYIERIGMRFGPHLNAYTSFDETVYMLQIPTDDAKIVDTGFRILRDWATAISFDPAEVDKERGVVIEEWRLGRGAMGRIRDKEFPVVFHGSRYAERLPIGSREILATAPVEQLRHFYRDWYRPELMSVVAVGDFDPDEIETQIKQQFGSIPKSTSAPAREEFPIPDHEETLTSVVTDSEATGISVTVRYKRPKIEYETIDDLRQLIVDDLYHDMMNHRLSELARAAEPPFLGAFAGSGPLGRTKSSYTLTARTANAGVERALATLLTEAKRVEEHGFVQTELDRAKTSSLRNIDRAYEERDKLESRLFASELVAHFLNDEPAASIEFYRDLYHRVLPTITLAEVNARAEQWLTETNRVILVNGPDKKEAAIPDEKRLLAVFEETEKVAVTPYVDRVRNEPLVAQAPAPGRIVQEEQFPEVGVTRWKLSNGAVVQLKPTDFKNDEILIRGWSPGGQSLAPDDIHFTAQQASPIVMRMGAGKFDSIELGKALTGKVAFIATTITETTEGLQGSASPRDLETMFQLLYLRFTGARRDEEAFTSYRTLLRGQLQNLAASPEYEFSRKMTEVLTQNHPRRRFLTVDDIDEIELDDALAFYKQRFGDASDFIFSIVGSFEVDEIRPLVEKWIGALPGAGRVETWRNVGVNEPAGVQTVTVEKGIEPRSSVRIVFHGDAKWSVENQNQIGALAEILRIRLRESLREDLGGVYGVGVAGGISRRPEEEYTFTISFGADPERVDELVAAVFSEIEKIRKDGPSDDHISRVQEMRRRERQVAEKQNGFWMSQLEFIATNDLEFSEINRHEERIKAITRDSVREAARQYLDRSRYVLGVLKPAA
ncbi:MAG TPA: insulinase family protein [Thermoanaerobaculia bacterium]